VLKSFLDFLNEIYAKLNKKNNKIIEEEEIHEEEKNLDGRKRVTFERQFTYYSQLHHKKIIGKEAKVVKILEDFKKFTDSGTQRNFLLFIDSNLRDSQLAKKCAVNFIKALKDTDRLSVIRVKEYGKIDILLSLTECIWAKKNIDYLVSMVENPSSIEYMTSSSNILECILKFLDVSHPTQMAKALDVRTSLSKHQKAESLKSLSSASSETWVIGIHGDMMTPARPKILSKRFKKAFRRFNMYTFLLGTKYDKGLGDLLEKEDENKDDKGKDFAYCRRLLLPVQCIELGQH
jgi:hypothetical protein